MALNPRGATSDPKLWEGKMKIGVSAFAWTREFNKSHFGLLPHCREKGFSCFEIPMFTPASMAASAIRRAFEKAELDCTVCAILPPGINPIDEDREIRKKSRQHLLDCIHTAGELGAKVIGGPIFAPIGYLPGHRRTEEQWRWALECFQSLGESLDANEITLCLEPVNRSETFFLRTASDAKRLCASIGHPRFGVTLDTFHANIEEKSIANAVRCLGPHLKHFHASENDRGILGSGHIDFPEIVNVLREIHYDGHIVLEGFGHSPGEKDAPGTLWADLTVSSEDIALEGLAHLRSLGVGIDNPGSKVNESVHETYPKMVLLQS
jgi:D-psicose/D-tagatose/L-ribulose 3-epimerase